MQPPLTSRRVLVVGASAGIGRSVAHHAAVQGAHVCGAARREQHLMELCRASGAKGYVVGDVAQLADCRAIVDGAVESLGGLDLVVYCAGTGTLAPIAETEPSRWAQDYAVNVIGAVQITAAALRHLDEHGLVAYVSSESTTEARWGMSSYSASKAALDASIRSWRLEHPERRFVRVVMGATMPTDFSAGFDAAILATALHRWGEAGISPALMETEDVGRHLAELFGLLLNHPTVDVPDITLDPRGPRGRHRKEIPMPNRFDHKVAVVTGAGGGIGEAYARALHAEGASVVVADIDEEGGAKVAVDLGERALFVRTDVSDIASTDAMAAAAMEAFGRIDHLVNNAAIYKTMELAALTSVDLDYLNRFLSVNLLGALHCTRSCLEPLAADGGGSIVNQSSTAAWMGISGFYGLAKAGINSLTINLAHELGWRNIRVNAIAPGPTDTEATRTQVPEEFRAGLLATLALRRMGEVDEMASALLFLLSDDAKWITGQILAVDGGQTVRL